MPNPRPMVVVAAGALLAFSSAPLIAQQKTLTVAAYGGSWEQTLRKFVIPDFEAKHGVKVEYVAGNSTDTLAKLQAQMENASPFPRAERIITIDGMRVEYADGFGLARASNTTPVIVLRFEADSAEALKRIQKDFRNALQPLKPNAPLPY